MRRFRYLLITLVVVLVASGCVRSDLAVTVNDDGSGTYTAIVAFNPKAFADLAKMTGEDPDIGEDPCKELRDSANQSKADLPTGASIENYTDGDFCGVKISAPFKAGDNPAAAIEEALGGMGESSEGLAVGLESFSIEKSGGGWVFEAKPQGGGTDTGSTGDMAMFESFMKGASSIVRIKLPGRMVEKDSNPDAVDGNGTMIWNINLMGDSRVLKARTEPGNPITNKTFTEAGKALPNIKGAGTGTSNASGSGDDGGSSALPFIIGGVVLVAAIVGFVLWRKSKGKAPAPVPAGGAMPGGAMAPMPGAPYADLPPSAPTVPTSWGAPPPSAPTAEQPGAWAAPAPSAPTAEQPGAWAAPAAPAAPAAEPAAHAAAPGEPQWDAARNAYILWDAGSSKWLQYDNAAGAWKPID